MSSSTMSSVPTDRNGLEVLDWNECLELAGSVPVARVAVNAAGFPNVFPVAHVMDGRTVVFRSAQGSKLDAAIMNRPVAVEVDHWDASSRTGWSVLILGTAEPLEDPEAVGRCAERAGRPWIDTPRAMEWVVVRATRITGRRIRGARG